MTYAAGQDSAPVDRAGQDSAPVDRTVDRWIRPVDHPVDRCTQEYPGRPPGRPWLKIDRSPGRPTVWWLLSVSVGRSPGRPSTWVGRPASRPTNAFWLSFLNSDSFSVWDQIQLGFPKTLRLYSYKYGLEPSCIISLKIPLKISLGNSLKKE